MPPQFFVNAPKCTLRIRAVTETSSHVHICAIVVPYEITGLRGATPIAINW
jgi:hypothetical protein